MPYCEACGYELKDPTKDLDDPDDLMGIVDGGVENPEAHLKVRDGPKGPRFYCAETGQVTKIIEDKENKEGEGGEPKSESGGQPKQKNQEIYDLPEEKGPMDVLREVVSKPFVGLDKPQLMEVKDWAEDYDGHLPPDALEEILKNMSGVQKQTAQLARKRYEVKLNKMVQQKSQGESGPPIGISSLPSPGGMGAGGGRGGGQRRQPQRQPEGGGGSGGQNPQADSSKRRNGSELGSASDVNASDLRSMRRVSRVRRRNKALDRAAEQAADEVAAQVAREFGESFGELRKIITTVFRKKAESDPDWFLEKAEKWDMDVLDAVLEKSDTKKQREGQQQGPATSSTMDDKVENALDNVMAEETDESDPPENTNNPPPEPEGAEIFDDDEPEQADDGEEDGLFEEEFGGMTQG